MDNSFEVRHATEMTEITTFPPKHKFPVEGLEDCRLFRYRGRLWCTCTTRERNAQGRCEIALVRLDDDYNVDHIQLLTGIHPGQHQKNWVPLVRGDDLFLIYSADPTVVLKYDFDAGLAAVHRVSNPRACLESCRGSSQALEVKDGWLYLAHESVRHGDGHPIYLHRFVLLTREFEVKAFTEPFFFVDKGIEFCAGLARDRKTNRLVASFGVNDARALLAFFNEQAVLSRLLG
jgi:hypothetical protein